MNGYVVIPKMKNTLLTYGLKIALVLALAFSVYPAGKNLLNQLPYMQGSQSMLASISDAAASATMLYIVPLISGLILFGIYTLLVHYTYNSAYRTLIVFGEQLDGGYFNLCCCAVFTGYALLRGAGALLWSYYPLAYNIGAPLWSVPLTLAAFALLFWLLARKVGKDFRPFLFSSLMLPSVLVLILA